MDIQNQPPKLVLTTTERLVVYDTIAGDYWVRYDDIILIFGKDIVNALRYIRLCYDYIFTGDHSVSWLQPPPIENRIKLDYNPKTGISYYIYNEILNKYNIIARNGDNINSILAIGNDYGVIEYLSKYPENEFAQNKQKINKSTATYIATHYSPENLEPAKNRILNEMLAGGIDPAEIITTDSNIYKLLDYEIAPVDIYTYDNFEMVRHFELMFSHINLISNIIGIISGLKYTKKGGVFIIHMYSIINKTNADLFILAKQYFETAELYMPECVNSFKHSGAWAIFKGFKGISTRDFDNLLDIVTQIKKYYPNGVQDSQVYEADIRAKCWSAKSFPRTGPRVPYITGFFDTRLDNPIYREIIVFNNQIYKRKYDFCNKVLKAMSEIKYPEKLGIPTERQQLASIKYLNKWGITYKLPFGLSGPKQKNTKKTQNKLIITPKKVYTYLFKSDTFSPNVIKDEFARRGNWVPYDETAGQKQGKPVDFLFIDGKNVDDESLYSLRSNLKSLVGDTKKQITDKNNLYENLLKIPGTRRFLPTTIPFSIKDTNIGYLNRFKKYFSLGKPYICKVIKGGAGRGIITTDKFEIFQSFMAGYYRKMAANPQKFKQYEWVLQEYITNPWLVDGKKCHLRQIMIYQADSQKPSYYMYSGEYAVAEKPYVQGNWTDKDIHDTHFHKGVGYEWPFDMNFTSEQWTTIKEQFDYIYSCILAVMKGRGLCYSDSKHCFELFGLDFMITTDLRLILIEVNAKIGMTPSKVFADKILKSLLVYVVDEYFPPKYSQQEYLHFYPIKLLGRANYSKRTLKKSQKYLL